MELNIDNDIENFEDNLTYEELIKLTDEEVVDYSFNCAYKRIDDIIEQYPDVIQNIKETPKTKMLMANGMPEKFAYCYSLAVTMMTVIKSYKMEEERRQQVLKRLEDFQNRMKERKTKKTTKKTKTRTKEKSKQKKKGTYETYHENLLLD
jgi:hypothetical protein